MTRGLAAVIYIHYTAILIHRPHSYYAPVNIVLGQFQLEVRAYMRLSEEVLTYY